VGAEAFVAVKRQCLRRKARRSVAQRRRLEWLLGSVLTGVLVDGLRSGSADLDGDELVHIDELAQAASGRALIARVPVVRPEPLPRRMVGTRGYGSRTTRRIHEDQSRFGDFVDARRTSRISVRLIGLFSPGWFVVECHAELSRLGDDPLPWGELSVRGGEIYSRLFGSLLKKRVAMS
jgi:hypothetical protein